VSAPSYADLIHSGASALRDAGIEDPVRDARQLLLFVAQFSSAELIGKEQDHATDAHQAAFQQLVRQRQQRIPMAHITGRSDFYGLTLKSDPRALIPRADSECVVDLALSLIPDHTAWRLADLGTGTGALLAALLSERPQSRGTAVEASMDALRLAADNFNTLGLSDRAQVFCGSWQAWSGWAHCDLIISNPPYICTSVLAELAPEVRDHDPRQALDGGADGLSAYRDIIAGAARHMKTGAHLVFEIGYDQKTAVSRLLETSGFTDLQQVRDLGGNDRAIAATKT
jgi:release factor glutamine methyltransferase